MNEQQLRQLIEEVDPNGKISQTQIEELVVSINNSIEKKEGETKGKVIFHTLENELRDQLDTTVDWRMKAKIAARIISLSLE